MLKAFTLMAMAAALALALAACGGNSGSSASSSASSASTSASSASASGSSIAQGIAALDGVKSVDPVDVSGSQVYAEKYVVTFEQSLDHKNPSAGTFPQRVEVGIVKDAKSNVMETDGYLLFDKAIAMDDAHELCSLLSGNYIHVEHCFFGQSRPASLSNDETDGWQYLTPENAAADYHRIYTELSKVLDGPWTATGTSRGNSDPWYSLRMHDTDNPNVKMFVSSTKPHTVSIMDFDQATMQEIGTFVSEVILGKFETLSS